MNKLYIVYEDYMGRKDIIGIFKNVENAKYYKENCSSFCYIKPIIIDFEIEKEDKQMAYKLQPDIDVKPQEIIKDRKKIEKQLAILRESFAHLGYDFHWEIYPMYQDRWEDRPYK